KVVCQIEPERQPEELKLSELAKRLPAEALSAITLNREKPRTVWVATITVEFSTMSGPKTVAIVMNAPTCSTATEVDYLVTNAASERATASWIVTTYSQRNWVEVFYREAKGWLGLKEYQIRGKRSLYRHLILVFCAYTFIIWHQLTGGLRRQWANQPLTTFTEALSAFRTAISYRFFGWLQENRDLFTLYKASLGFVWA
ncbi:transposase IS4 family protein, partial [Microcoleus vaginatus FGP-2]